MSLREQFERLKEENGHERFSIVLPSIRLNLADPDQRALYDWLQELRDRNVSWGEALSRAFAGHLRDPKKSADVAEYFQSLEDQLEAIKQMIENGDMASGSSRSSDHRSHSDDLEIAPKLGSSMRARVASLAEEFDNL